jgi:hypothetical protein
MKKAVLGALVGAGLAIVGLAAAPEHGELPVPRFAAGQSAAGGDLIALSALVGDKYQQVTVIDGKNRVIAVYHVELATGEVKLRCVRNIHWDLQLMHYNGQSPLPREIQSLVEPSK